MPVIQNAGYMWHRKYIDWNEAFEKNALWGTSERDTGKKVNFAYQSGIYILYDRNLECVYIGQAGKGENTGLFKRLQNHVINDSLFCAWERFTWFGFYSTETLISDKKYNYKNEFKVKTDVNELMNIIESMMIRAQAPAHNKSKGSLGLTGEHWYYQIEEYYEDIHKYQELKKVIDQQIDKDS